MLQRHYFKPAPSAALAWAPLDRFVEAERNWGALASRQRWTRYVYEFVRFGIKQAWACLFGAMMLGLILATHWLYPKDASVARYDVLVLAAVAFRPECSGSVWRRGRRHA